ncbi:MAG: hypothetical protein QOD73_3542, partial [Solirubrobacteraceae bacterium]|nr:hypothetical protein [Solirubrobacteraceae bacterium]
RLTAAGHAVAVAFRLPRAAPHKDERPAVFQASRSVRAVVSSAPGRQALGIR